MISLPYFLALVISGSLSVVSGAPCLKSCDKPPSPLSAKVLQTCINKCETNCCGNRLNGKDPTSSSHASFLTCANGCEIAYHTPWKKGSGVKMCKSQCKIGSKEGCEYKHPNIREIFSKCGEDCSGCPDGPKASECADGCDAAKTLRKKFYKIKNTDPDTCKLEDNVTRFLFSGQSNMEGNSNEALEGLFDEMIKILNSDVAKKRKMNSLIKLMNRAEDSNKDASRNQAKLILKMKNLQKYIVKDHKTATCSFTEPNKEDFLSCERPASPTAGCGAPFGPELMFSHTFSRLQKIKKKIGIVKVAVGGTTLYENWSKSQQDSKNNYWWALRDAVAAAKGSIEAFVWFQGEEESLLERPAAEKYLDRLTELVKNVRTEIRKAAPSKFATIGDVPVVIVELGQWPYADLPYGKAVIKAQQKFVKRDNNAILVKTGAGDDRKKGLSEFYHFDAAAMLIIGDRIAKGLQALLDQKKAE